jgi:ribosome-associated translation inhibitor RaiA
MKTALQITYRQMESSPTVDAAVTHEVERLERIHPSLSACEVIVSAPHRHQHQGQLFHVTVRLTEAGADVVASRDAGQDPGHEDVQIAIRDAFRAVRRELEKLAGHLHQRRA